MIARLRGLRRHGGFMKYFKNTSWLFAEKLLRMGIGLFVGVWVARYLGPEQYGLFSYAVSFVGLFTAFSTLGLDAIVVKKLVDNDAARDRLLGTAFVLKLAGAFFVFAALSVAVGFTSNDDVTNRLIFVTAGIIVFQSFNVIDFYFQSRVLSKYVVYANLSSLFLSSCLKIVLILIHAELVAFALAGLFDSAVVAAGLFYFYSRNRRSARAWKFDGAVAGALLRESWPLMFSGMVLMIQARIDQVMLKEMTNSAEVGYYSVALRLIEAIGFIPMILKNSLFPSIVKAKRESEQTYRARLLNFYRLNFLIFLLTATPIFFLSEQIVLTLFGTAYHVAGALLSLMAVRLFFTNMGVARSAFLLMENLQKFSLITMVSGTIVNVTLNYFWIPQYGSQGAIIATIASFTVTTFVIDSFYGRTRQNVMLQLTAIGTFYRLKVKEERPA